MQLKTIRENLRGNLLFLTSCAANVMLCASKIIKVDFFWLMVGIAIFVLSLLRSDFGLKESMQTADSVTIVWAALFQFVLGYRFYSTFTTGQLAEYISANYISPDVLFFVLGGCLSIIGMPSMIHMVKWLLMVLRSFREVFRSMYRQFGIISVIYIIGLSAIIRANYYYVDDLGRTLQGYQLTGDFSRYLASFFSLFLHGNAWLTDISPLTQWFAALIMAYAAILLLYIVTENTKHTGWSLVAVIPFGLFPYFLQCYSYKFDAPYMALSVLAAIAPLIYRNCHPVKFGIAALVGTLLVCLTYQASSGIFPMLVVILLFMQWIRCEDSKKTLVFLIAAASGYIAGVLIFRYALMGPIVEHNYVSASVSLNYLVPNLKQYATLILSQFNKMWLLIIGVVLLSFVYVALQWTNRQKFVTLIATATTLMLMAVLSFGAYIVFRNPTFDPRGMYGFGIFISVICILSVDRLNLSKVAVTILAWLFFVFSFTYGNALNIQNEYTEFRLQQVLTDLNHVDSLANRSSRTVQVSGTIGHAPAVENMIEQYGVLKDLVPVQFSDWIWGDCKLLNYYDTDFLTREFDYDLLTLDMPMVSDTMYHQIYMDDEHILIVLK